ncbi:hypothetical protein OK074_4202 [Actinobacteria bacterium OK074]|nr:hypothetical protein OK074_4202 [Actinobacteria bacterium OK074]
MAMTPDISGVSVRLLREVVGLYPEERIAQRAMETADDILSEYGSDGLRVLVMVLTGWAAVGIERHAMTSHRPPEALLDEMDLLRFEVDPGDGEE